MLGLQTAKVGSQTSDNALQNHFNVIFVRGGGGGEGVNDRGRLGVRGGGFSVV